MRVLRSKLALVTMLVLLTLGLAGAYIFSSKLPKISPGLQDNKTWTLLGPAPLHASQPVSGRILSIAVDNKDIYVGTADGGLWLSQNHGVSWNLLSSNKSSLAISSIAIDSKNPRVIYLGTGESHSFLGSYSYPNAFYGTGILKSTDGGHHWTPMGRSVFRNHAIRTVLVDGKQASVLFAAAGHNIYKSTDSGRTWTTVYAGANRDRVMQIVQNAAHPKQMFAGVEGVGLLESKNAGNTWTPVRAMPDASGISGISLAFSPHKSNEIYCFVSNSNKISDSGLYVSQTDGKTWTKRTELKHVVSEALVSATAGVEIAVDPAQPSHLFVGGYHISESSDKGRTWTTVNGVHVDDHAIAFGKHGTAYFGTDGGIWSDHNGDIKDLNSNLSITQFYPGITVGQNGNIFGGTQDNGTVEYSAKTKSWIEVHGGDGGYTAESPQNSKVVYSETDFPRRLYRSTDGGGVWSNDSPIFSSSQKYLEVMPLTVSSQNPNHLLLGADRVYASHNAGVSWTPISPIWHQDGSVNVVTSLTQSSHNPKVLYAGTIAGELYKTTNGGKNWTDITPDNAVYDSPTMVVSIVLSPHYHNGVYAVFGSNSTLPFYSSSASHVFYSRNGGNTWSTVDGNLPHTPVSSAILYKHAIVLGTAKGVYASPWGSKSWISVGKGLPDSPVTDIRFAKGRLYAATVGRGIWTMKLSK